ncbi:hypothetical protein [Fredinandcohnia quinoae]|uniref:Small CPxCG-related zinc finger protein n=1 Tax=Fredinandcohnia quinoae TaxID=2918902 RepID=A0AAW5ECX3_9BACI|nr:hypothetical protein [Fredinandcohnia sp. SECRCQ15]MCH1627757.1 hypothetical protein [Fredinandcohnia sp. SECRCQ15]
MSSNCFYCEHPFEDQKFHYVAFVNVDTEREEVLCGECYQEWLEGIKD